MKSPRGGWQIDHTHPQTYKHGYSFFKNSSPSLGMLTNCFYASPIPHSWNPLYWKWAEISHNASWNPKHVLPPTPLFFSKCYECPIHFERFWAILSDFERFWAILSDFERFLLAVGRRNLLHFSTPKFLKILISNLRICIYFHFQSKDFYFLFFLKLI